MAPRVAQAQERPGQQRRHRMSRINRAIELLAAGQPVYCDTVKEPSYEVGRAQAGTWADYLTIDLEHHPFAPAALHAFMRGLVDGGPTRSGHRTPAVIVTLPMDGTDEQAVRTNAWMIKQALAAGAHGLLLCHAETAAAVRAFVEASRYPFHPAGEGLSVGRRGSGGQDLAAEIWGLSPVDYLERADVWPWNPGASCCSASRSRTAARSRTPRRARRSRASPSPNGGRATWAWPSATRTPTIRPTRPRWPRPAPGQSRLRPRRPRLPGDGPPRRRGRAARRRRQDRRSNPGSGGNRPPPHRAGDAVVNGAIGQTEVAASSKRWSAVSSSSPSIRRRARRNVAR